MSSSSLPSDVDDSLKKWVHGLSLSEHERKVLRSHAWLSANHISAAQQLLKRDFPQQEGLQDTHYLLEKMVWSSSPSSFVQIIHVGGYHWACLSNKLSPDSNTIQLYDSLLSTPGTSIIEQACTILRCDLPSFKIQVMNVKLQSSSDSCGLYAIAMARDLCAGRDPCFIAYIEPLMRSHLEQCYESEKLSHFPRAKTGRECKRRVYKEIVVEVFCTCRFPDVHLSERFGDMAECDVCCKWYHKECAAIPDKVFKKSWSGRWICSKCS